MRLVGKLDDTVSNKGKVIAELRRLASGAFDAGMGGQAGKNELLNSPFAKLLIKICSLKGIKRPMPTGHDVASLWIKRLVEIRTGFAFPEEVIFHGHFHADWNFKHVIERMLMESVRSVHNLNTGHPGA